MKGRNNNVKQEKIDHRNPQVELKIVKKVNELSSSYIPHKVLYPAFTSSFITMG